MVASVDDPTNVDIWLHDLERDTPTRFTFDPTLDAFPIWTPDGERVVFSSNRGMAYTSDETGQSEVYVRPFPNVDEGRRVQVSTDGGVGPLWGPDGHELFYGRPQQGDQDAAMMVVAVETEPTFSRGTPAVVFEGPYALIGISPDGQRFLVTKEATTTDAAFDQSQVTVVENWHQELLERVPIS